MKRKLFLGTTGIFSLLLITGCAATAPAPVADANAGKFTELISHCDDVEFFDSEKTQLTVMVAPNAAFEELSLIDTLKNALKQADINCVSAGKDYDFQININSLYRQLTSAPQCRLDHRLAISITAADGREVVPEEILTVATSNAFPTSADAKAKLRPLINDSIKTWVANNFKRGKENIFKVSIVRFKMSKKLIEFDPNQFEKDLQDVIGKLRKTDGVVDARIIEANKKNRIVSCRILSRKNNSVKNAIQNQK